MPGQVSNPVTVGTAADLSATTNRYLLGKITSTGLNVCDTAGEMVDGVVGCATTTTAAPLERGPITTVRAGATFSRGAKLATNASGKAVAATDGQHVFGKALEAATAINDEVSVLWVSSFPPSLDVDSVEAVSAPGAIPTTASYVLLSVDGTDALTLDDGDIGHEITIEAIAAANTPIGTVTANGAQGAYGTESTTLAIFNGVGQKATWRMTSTGWKFISGFGVETRTSGALGLPYTTHNLSVTNTVAFSLAAGQQIGQRKRIECTAVSGTPLGTLTLADAYASESLTHVFTALGQAIVLEWTATGWKLIDLIQAGSETVAAAGTANPLCLVHLVDCNAVDFIQGAAIFPTQRSIWFVNAATGAASTISGVYYDEDGSADGIDLNVNAVGDMAVLDWAGAAWLATSLVSCTVTT